VSRELSSSDKALLEEEEGASLPQHYHRKRKSKHIDSDTVEGEYSGSRRQPPGSGTTSILVNAATSGKQWEDVKQYLDPNPQLKGVDKGRYATKVS
jgi:hypothetical protein